MPTCSHEVLRSEPSTHAADAGYRMKTAKQRYDATRTHASRARETPIVPEPTTFPAPLVLPEDELSWDPTYPVQPLKEWANASYRNAVTPERRTIYLAPPPSYSLACSHIAGWAEPVSRSGDKTLARLRRLCIDDVQSYLGAFYHPLPVKTLSKPHLEYIPWEDSPEPTTAKPTSKGKTAKRGPEQPHSIALSTGAEAIRIRARPTGDKLFAAQLNLNDLLDVAMEILPEDAYAVLMLVDHDLYEDDEDDFCCGRAYGGSRVAVVSTARYHPRLDHAQNVERDHAWPASHCAAHLQERCDSVAPPPAAPANKKRKTAKLHGPGDPQAKGHFHRDSPTALASAVRAFRVPDDNPNESAVRLWLSRVCKTASHELGHCFGLDHCVYYACIMQGTAGLSEDARQPPYLCPVCLAKVRYATGAAEKDMQQQVLRFCEKVQDQQGLRQNDTDGRSASGGMFAAFAAWLQVRISEIDESVDKVGE